MRYSEFRFMIPCAPIRSESGTSGCSQSWSWSWRLSPNSYRKKCLPNRSNEEEQRLSLLVLERELHVWWLSALKHNVYMMVDLRERETDLEREIEIFSFSDFDFRGRGTTPFPLLFFFFFHFILIKKIIIKKKRPNLIGGITYT